MYVITLCCYSRGCDTWSVTLRKDCTLGLGTVVISPYSFMAESNRKLEKTS